MGVNGSGDLYVTTSAVPDQFPLLHFKFSTSTPCINYYEEPESNTGLVIDEYTYSEECTVDEYLNTATNTNYRLVAGDFTIDQGTLESDNGITDILNNRFNRNDIDMYEAVKQRKLNELSIYQKSVIGWKLSCEASNDSSQNFSRLDAYDLIYKKKLNT